MMIFNSRDRECVVTLSEAKGLSRAAARSFAALRMTGLDLAVDEELSRAFEPCLREELFLLLPLHDSETLKYWFVIGSASHGHIGEIIIRCENIAHMNLTL